MDFAAENDDAAFKHARQFVNGYDAELWSGGRFVAKLMARRSEP